MLTDVYDGTLILYLTIAFAAHVDDATISIVGFDNDGVSLVAPTTDHVAYAMEALGLAVSTTKSTAIASKLPLCAFAIQDFRGGQTISSPQGEDAWHCSSRWRKAHYHSPGTPTRGIQEEGMQTPSVTTRRGRCGTHA